MLVANTATRFRPRQAIPNSRQRAKHGRLFQSSCQEAKQHAGNIEDRYVAAPCIHCLKAGLLHPQFSTAYPEDLQLKLRKPMSPCTHKAVEGEADKPKGTSKSNPRTDRDKAAKESSEADEQQNAPVVPEESESAGVRMALATLRFYKREISPILPPSCRFIPTCSEYAMDSFKKFGVKKGFILTAWRLLRCNPFGPSGYDPVKWPPPGLERYFSTES